MMYNPNTRRGFTQKVANKNCHPEFISGSTPLVITPYKEEMLKQVQHDKGMGFTLIELLIVVLIIGILAAVAVPQYQRAVEKARMTEAIVNVRAIANAHQLYYLANGEYLGPADMEKLDVDIPGALIFGKRIKTKDFYYSPNGVREGTYTNRLALAWRVKDGNDLYKIYVDQNEPGRIRCSDDDLHVASAIQLKLCSELDEKGTL